MVEISASTRIGSLGNGGDSEGKCLNSLSVPHLGHFQPKVRAKAVYGRRRLRERGFNTCVGKAFGFVRLVALLLKEIT